MLRNTMVKRLIQLGILLFAAGSAMGAYSGTPSRFDEENTRGNFLLSGDEKNIIWFNGENWIAFRASGSIISNFSYVWPATETAGFVLQTDGAGAMSWASAGDMVYGGISRVENAAETTIASAGVKVQVDIFNRNAPSNNTTPDHATDDITITVAGVYHIAISATVNSVAGASSVMELEIMKNNGASRIGDLHADRSIGGGGTERGSISLSDIVALEANDTVEVWIENETNTQNYIVEDITLSLFRLGEITAVAENIVFAGENVIFAGESVVYP